MFFWGGSGRLLLPGVGLFGLGLFGLQLLIVFVGELVYHVGAGFDLHHRWEGEGVVERGSILEVGDEFEEVGLRHFHLS